MIVLFSLAKKSSAKMSSSWFILTKQQAWLQISKSNQDLN